MGKSIYITEKEITAIFNVMDFAENIYLDPDDPDVEDESTKEIFLRLKSIYEKYIKQKK